MFDDQLAGLDVAEPRRPGRWDRWEIVIRRLAAAWAILRGRRHV